MQVAIVVNAYTRPAALARLFSSLQQAAYPGAVSVPLVVSIDRGGSDEVRQIADNFAWPHGPKEVFVQTQHLGLVQHFFACGKLTERFDAIVYLEDDLYERVDGQNMWETLARQPWRFFEFARQTAELHGGMHANATRPDLPPLHRKLEWKLNQAENLPTEIQRTLLAALAALPQGTSICHGDFHPANILLTLKHAVVIDWIDASLGNPLADVARTSIICLGAVNSSQIPNAALKLGLRLFHSLYLRRYTSSSVPVAGTSTSAGYPSWLRHD